MQVDDRQLTEGRSSSGDRRTFLWIGAAAVVVVAGVIYVSTSRESGSALATNAVDLPVVFEPVAPGVYQVDTDANEETTSIRATFVMDDDGWASLEAGVLREATSGVNSGVYVSLMVVEVEGVWDAGCGGVAAAPAGTSAEALSAQFAAMPGFVTLEELTPVSAFGADGYHLVLEVPSLCTEGEANVWTGGVWGERFYQAEGQIVELWFLDGEAATVMVEATRPPDSDEETARELNAALDTVLDTLVVAP
jgi:hypothetical protein